jgi:group I intron endonuclease
MLNSGIYEIYCVGDKRNYIGQAGNLDTRWSEHLTLLRHNKHFNRHLQNAFNKYGVESFSFETIELCEIQRLDEKEVFYIKERKAHRSLGGFNASWGGEAPFRGLNHTEETKKILSEKTSGENNPMFGRKGKDNPKFGIPIPEDQRIKIGLAQKGEKHHNFGKRASEETRRKMSLARSGEKNHNFGKSMSNEQKEKISKTRIEKGLAKGENNSFYGKVHTDEAKKLIGAANSGKNSGRFGKKNPNASSKYFGVRKTIRDGKRCYWVADITLRRKTTYIGTFKTEIEAAKAYNSYVRKNKLPNPLNKFPRKNKVG